MKFTEITVFTNRESSELVAYFLQEVCMDGVSIYDKTDFDNGSWDYKDDGAELVYDKEVKVKGYCENENANDVLNFLRESFSALSNAGSLRVETTQVDGDSWVEKWHETFQPIETEKVIICPEWQSVESNKPVLMLDTGVAFGTGQHETTSMCIEHAEKLNLENKSVLDVGCGSGILGLTSLLLGAKCATLVDIDSQATDACRHNAEINNFTDKCTIITGDLTKDVKGTFDIVFANLTADILKLLFGGISGVVHSGTVVILSGILDKYLPMVKELYCKKFSYVTEYAKGEWRALVLVKE